MDTYTFVAPCHFGLESVLKRELQDLGCEISLVEDGRVTFRGGMDTLCRANIFLRTAERVLLQAGRFRAESFDELFENIKAIPWEEYIPADGKFWVTKATSVKSRLFSPSDIQSIVKKAMVERLKQRYGVSWFPESGKRWNCALICGMFPATGSPTELMCWSRGNTSCGWAIPPGIPWRWA